MLFVVPDFYEDFHCLAGKCAHSCCVGWEIDIDEDSFAYYSGIEGELGIELREKISAEPTKERFPIRVSLIKSPTKCAAKVSAPSYAKIASAEHMTPNP